MAEKPFSQVKGGGGIQAVLSIARRGGQAATVKQAVPDGDTISTSAPGNLPVRFLGVDTPESKFNKPGTEVPFISLDDDFWKEYLAAMDWAAWDAQPPAHLQAHWETLLGADTAANHKRHASAAAASLETMVQGDIGAFADGDSEQAQFYLRFSREVFDSYGRLLAFINVNVADAAQRPKDYNTRQLAEGFAAPLYIWPNISPFFKGTVLDAVLPPGSTLALAEGDAKLRDARQAVNAARLAGLGIHAAADPLRMLAHEFRDLARRRLPSRWVIDLSSNSNRLIHPTRYFEVVNPEDRLYVPGEFKALFEQRGWVADAG